MKLSTVTKSLLPMLFVACQTLTAEELKPLAPGAPVDYSSLAMQPQSWKNRGLSLKLTPWEGKKIVFLTTSDKFDHELMATWVERLDAGWQLYADLTGRSPEKFRQIGGKTTIAAVPEYDLTCGAGCGYIGASGIELAMFYDDNYPMLKSHPKAMPHYVFYEMGRNYYTFGDRHSCFITGFAVFMRYVCMDDLKCEDLEPGLRKTIEGVETRFASTKLSFLDIFTNITWKNEKASRIRNARGKIIEPSDQPVTYASAMMRLHRENGGDAWLKRFYSYLAASPKADPNTKEGGLKQGMCWMLSASLAAQKNLSPLFCDQWHYPMTQGQRKIMADTDWKKLRLDVGTMVDLLGK